MAILVFAIILLAVLVMVAAALKNKNVSAPIGDWPFEAKRPLSQPEQVLYYRIIESMPGYVILPQVGLSRFLTVKKGNNVMEWNNRINRMSVDYLVCDKSMQIIAAIELDDASHERPGRQEADAKKDQVLAAAGIKLIRWNVKSLPDMNTIAAALI